MLAVFYFFGFRTQSTITITIIGLGLFMLSMFLTAGFGYWINDWFDIKLDKMAKKTNYLFGKSILFKITGATLLALSGIFFWFSTAPSWYATIGFFLFHFFLILYSIPPFRLKNNPILGPICDIHYGHVLVVFVPVLYLHSDLTGLDWSCIALVYSLCFIKGARNILLHQLDDRKGDKLVKLNSFPNQFGALFTLRIINKVLLPLEFIVIILIISSYYTSLNTIAIGFASFLLFQFLNFSGWKFMILPKRQLQFKFLYFLNDFYEYWLPYLCIWNSTIQIELKVVLTAIHLIVFYQGVFKFVRDIRKIGVNLNIIRT